MPLRFHHHATLRAVFVLGLALAASMLPAVVAGRFAARAAVPAEDSRPSAGTTFSVRRERNSPDLRRGFT